MSSSSCNLNASFINNHDVSITINTSRVNSTCTVVSNNNSSTCYNEIKIKMCNYNHEKEELQHELYFINDRIDELSLNFNKISSDHINDIHNYIDNQRVNIKKFNIQSYQDENIIYNNTKNHILSAIDSLKIKYDNCINPIRFDYIKIMNNSIFMKSVICDICCNIGPPCSFHTSNFEYWGRCSLPTSHKCWGRLCFYCAYKIINDSTINKKCPICLDIIDNNILFDYKLIHNIDKHLEYECEQFEGIYAGLLKPIICHHCNDIFNNLSSLIVHLCNKKFYDLSSLTVDLSNYRDIKICSFTF